MPRYYCDYCDTYLTHDSPSVRKQHNSGYKHKANIRAYYQKFEEQQTQILIDQKIKEHHGQTAVYQQIGAAYNQHLAAFPGARPIIPHPMLPVPGAVPSQLLPGNRPPLLPMPFLGAPGYGNAPMRPMPAPLIMPLPPNRPPMPPPSTSVPLPVPGEERLIQPPSTAGGYSYSEAPQNNQ